MHEGNEGKVARTCAVRPHQGADAMTGVLPVPQSFRTAPGRCIRSFGCAGQCLGKTKQPLEQRLKPARYPRGMPEEGYGEAVFGNGAGRTMQGRRNAAPALTGRQGARSGDRAETGRRGPGLRCPMPFRAWSTGARGPDCGLYPSRTVSGGMPSVAVAPRRAAAAARWARCRQRSTLQPSWMP